MQSVCRHANANVMLGMHGTRSVDQTTPMRCSWQIVLQNNVVSVYILKVPRKSKVCIQKIKSRLTLNRQRHFTFSPLTRFLWSFGGLSLLQKFRVPIHYLTFHLKIGPLTLEWTINPFRIATNHNSYHPMIFKTYQMYKTTWGEKLGQEIVSHRAPSLINST